MGKKGRHNGRPHWHTHTYSHTVNQTVRERNTERQAGRQTGITDPWGQHADSLIYMQHTGRLAEEKCRLEQRQKDRHYM